MRSWTTDADDSNWLYDLMDEERLVLNLIDDKVRDCSSSGFVAQDKESKEWYFCERGRGGRYFKVVDKAIEYLEKHQKESDMYDYIKSDAVNARELRINFAEETLAEVMSVECADDNELYCEVHYKMECSLLFRGLTDDDIHEPSFKQWLEEDAGIVTNWILEKRERDKEKENG